jgi:GT2 family glycosyltransferase
VGSPRRKKRQRLQNVMVAIPTRDHVFAGTVARLQEIRDANPGLPRTFYGMGRTSAEDTRNVIAERFLDSDCDVLLSVDDDIIPPLDVLRLVEHIREDERWGIVGAVYGISDTEGTADIKAAVFDEADPGSGWDWKWAPPGEGLQEHFGVGLGCVAISRRVFEALGPRPFALTYDEAHNARIAPDPFLCEKIGELGLRVGVDWSIRAHHYCRLII